MCTFKIIDKLIKQDVPTCLNKTSLPAHWMRSYSISNRLILLVNLLKIGATIFTWKKGYWYMLQIYVLGKTIVCYQTWINNFFMNSANKNFAEKRRKLRQNLNCGTTE